MMSTHTISPFPSDDRKQTRVDMSYGFAAQVLLVAPAEFAMTPDLVFEVDPPDLSQYCQSRGDDGIPIRGG